MSFRNLPTHYPKSSRNTMEALSGDMGFGFDFRMNMNMNINSALPQQAPMSTSATTAPLMPGVPVATAHPASTIGEWKEWDDAAFDSMNFELDLGFDTFLLATADDFMEPLGLAAQNPVPVTSAALMSMNAPVSPAMFSDLMDSSSSCTSESEASVVDDELPMVASPAIKMEMTAPVKRSRKRKIPETQKPQANATKPVPSMVKVADKKAKMMQQKNKAAPISAEAERLYRRRYDILHEILEAWNTGGIEDMEEIADDVYDHDVTLVSPDYSEGLKGVQALMHHWSLLLDSFPDGIMEEYQIERDDPEGQKMNVTWVFSGTQIFPFFGVEPRHEKVTIRGKSFFTFKGEKISQMVLSWNYREALMKLMGVGPQKNASDRR